MSKDNLGSNLVFSCLRGYRRGDRAALCPQEAKRRENSGRQIRRGKGQGD